MGQLGREDRPTLRLLAATNLCFAERNVYTSEVLAVVMQQLMEQSPLPMLLMRTVIQSLTMYPRLGGFVMNILSRLIMKQVTWPWPPCPPGRGLQQDTRKVDLRQNPRLFQPACLRPPLGSPDEESKLLRPASPYVPSVQEADQGSPVRQLEAGNVMSKGGWVGGAGSRLQGVRISGEAQLPFASHHESQDAN